MKRSRNQIIIETLQRQLNDLENDRKDIHCRLDNYHTLLRKMITRNLEEIGIRLPKTSASIEIIDGIIYEHFYGKNAE